MRVCSVEGCGGPVKTRGWCQKHYFRWRRHGDPEKTVIRPPEPKPEKCIVQGCGDSVKSIGMCSMHEARYRRHGSADRVIEPKDRAVRRREEHHVWVGESAGYDTAHSRLRRWKGLASAHLCVTCGRRAEEWSYDHSDPHERLDDRGYAFSLDPERYEPRCVPCHRAFDAGRRDAHKSIA